MNKGNYALQLTSIWGVAGSGANYTLTFVNCKSLALYGSGAAGLNSPQASGTNVLNTSITEFITITAANASITISGNGSTTTPTASDLFIYQLPTPIN